MSINILQDILRDADLFGFISAGGDVCVYDRVANNVFQLLSNDQSLNQIEALLWDAFYLDFCICTIGNTPNSSWILERDQAVSVIGRPERFKGLASNIRHQIFNL